MELRKKLAYMAVLTAGIFLLPLPFALTDPIFSPVNYLFTPLSVVVQMLLFFLADCVICLVERKRKKGGKV